MLSTIEDWLEKTLQEYVVCSRPAETGGNQDDQYDDSHRHKSQKVGTHERKGVIGALRELQFDRNSLSDLGLDKLAQDRIYRSFYVHCHSIHEVISSFQLVHPSLSTRLWELFAALFQHFNPQLRNLYLSSMKENQDERALRRIQLLSEEVDRLQAEIQVLKSDKNKHQVLASSALYTQELTSVADRERIRHLESSLRQSQFVVEQQDKTLKELRTLLIDRREHSRLVDAALVVLSKEHKISVETVEELQLAKKKLENDVFSLRSKASSLEQSLKTAKEELSSLSMDFRETTRSWMKLQDEHARTLADLESNKRFSDQLQSQLRDVQTSEKTTYDTLNHVVSSFNQQVAQLQLFCQASNALETVARVPQLTVQKVLGERVDLKYCSQKSATPELLGSFSFVESMERARKEAEEALEARRRAEEEAALALLNEATEGTEENGSEAEGGTEGGAEGGEGSDSAGTKSVSATPTPAEPAAPLEPLPTAERLGQQYRQQYMRSLKLQCQGWGRFMNAIPMEYFALSQLPGLQEAVDRVCSTISDYRKLQSTLSALELRFSSSVAWSSTLGSVSDNLQAKVKARDEDIQRLGADLVMQAGTIAQRDSQLSQAAVFQEKYEALEPKFIQLLAMYKESVSNKEAVDEDVRKLQETIAKFEEREIEAKRVAIELQNTKRLVTERDNYVDYLKAEIDKMVQQLVASTRDGRGGRTKKRSVNSDPSYVESGSVIAKLRQSISASMTSQQMQKFVSVVESAVAIQEAQLGSQPQVIGEDIGQPRNISAERQQSVIPFERQASVALSSAPTSEGGASLERQKSVVVGALEQQQSVVAGSMERQKSVVAPAPVERQKSVAAAAGALVERQKSVTMAPPVDTPKSHKSPSTQLEPWKLASILASSPALIKAKAASRVSTEIIASTELSSPKAGMKKQDSTLPIPILHIGGYGVNEDELDDLETVISDSAEALLTTLLSLSEMVQIAQEMHAFERRIHLNRHSTGSLTAEGQFLMHSVESVEKCLENIKAQREVIHYDASYKLEPTLKRDLLQMFDALLHMPANMLQIMHYADEMFDLRWEKSQLQTELEKLKLLSAKERARIIESYEAQLEDMRWQSVDRNK